MSLSLILKGLIIGIVIAAPVGPVAVLCIRRTLLQGHRAGLASGMGAVTADVIYGTIAAFGVAAIADLLLSHQDEMRLLGGSFLIVMGINTFFKAPPKAAGPPILGRLVRAYASAFLLTITNPLTIIGFTGIFAGFGLAGTDMSLSASWTLVAGVAIGAVLWWCGLTLTSGLLRHRLRADHLNWLNKLSGALIGACGAATLASLLL